MGPVPTVGPTSTSRSNNSNSLCFVGFQYLDVDVSFGDAETGKLRSDVLFCRLDSLVAVFEALGKWFLEGNPEFAVPDLLVAVIARETDCSLVTRNKNDFDKTPVHQLLDVDIIE